MSGDLTVVEKASDSSVGGFRSLAREFAQRTTGVLLPVEEAMLKDEGILSSLHTIAEGAVKDRTKYILNQDRLLGRYMAKRLLGVGVDTDELGLNSGDMYLDEMLPGARQRGDQLIYPSSYNAFGSRAGEPLTNVDQLIDIWNEKLIPTADQYNGLASISDEQLLQGIRYFAALDDRKTANPPQWMREMAKIAVKWLDKNGINDSPNHLASWFILALVSDRQSTREMFNDNLVAFRKPLSQAEREMSSEKGSEINYLDTKEMFDAQKTEILQIMRGMSEGFEEIIGDDSKNDLHSKAEIWKGKIDSFSRRATVVIDIDAKV